MSQSIPEQSFDNAAKEILVKLVTSLLQDKPKDPVPYIYSYLLDLSKGKQPNPITDNELNELKNLRKKVEFLKDQLDEADDPASEQSEEDDEDVGDIQPKKKDVKTGRQGVSAEVYGDWNKKGDFVPKVVPKNQETQVRLKKRLMEAFMFNALDEKEFQIVVDAIEERKFAAGEIAIREGDQGEEMYVVESGILSCTKVFKGNTEATFLKEFNPGEGFGELALLYNAPRAATITAKTDTILWGLDRATFNNIVKDAAAKKRDRYDAFLQSVKILSSMDPYERSKLGDALKEEKFKAGDYLIKEGEIGDKFFIISEGDAIATKSLEPGKEPSKVFEYKRGDYCGERALLTNEARAANIVAITDVAAVTLERDTFHRVLGPLEDILKRNMDNYDSYKK